MTDAGLKQLAGLKSLQSLRLGGEQVTDFGLRELARLPSLQTLSLGFTEVTDIGLRELAGLQSLQTLNLLNNKRVTPAGVSDLQKALPALKIKFSR